MDYSNLFNLIVDYSEHIGDNVCSDSNMLRGLKIAGIVLLLAKMLIPIIIIVIGSMDLFKAVTANENTITKQAKQLLIRVVIGLLIFFFPTIISTILNMTDLVPDEYEKCEKCVLEPLDCES